MCNSLGIIVIFFAGLSRVHARDGDTQMYCEASNTQCEVSREIEKKFIFYDVNPQEGFNLKRDVYMRFAVMIAEFEKKRRKSNWNLVLPPWYRLYHWRSDNYKTAKPVPWSVFFDISSLQTFAPVLELFEAMNYYYDRNEKFILDRLYVLQNFPNAFENGKFVEKWSINKNQDCQYKGHYWGYSNITAKETICVMFQGKASKLLEIISLHSSDTSVMFANGEIALHDSYGSNEYWDCRKSMKFSKELLNIADIYIRDILKCVTVKCSNYLSVHWRRQDFAKIRKNDIPSIGGAAQQINNFITENQLKLTIIFIATDATRSELEEIVSKLESKGFEVYLFIPTGDQVVTYKDGGVAIIDQIICSRSAFFIGSYESTFTFRIQEEREIYGFPSNTTFNRLCPDAGYCEPLTQWTLME